MNDERFDDRIVPDGRMLMVWRTAEVLAALPLEDMLTKIGTAETVGPILEPTLYRDRSDAMAEDKQMIEAALCIKRALLDIKARHEGREVVS